MQPSDYFKETAHRLGYKAEELLPIYRADIEAQSAGFTKGMSQKQRDYYINKKMVTLMQRQNGIIAEIEREIKKKQLSYKLATDHKQKLHNPAILKIIAQHQKIIQNNIKYLNTLHRRQELEDKRKSVSSNASLRKRDHDIISNKSSISRHSKSSNNSKNSSITLKSCQSGKQRLYLVRERQQQKQRLAKIIFKQRQQQKSRKSLKAEEEVLKRSQRVKTRSDINKQIVDENRRDLKYLQNMQIKEHFERLKFKMQKTEEIRAKNAKNREQRMRDSDYRDFRRQIQNEQRKMTALRYMDRERTAQVRLENQEVLKSQARSFNKMAQTLKYTSAKQNREMQAQNQQSFLQAVAKNQEQRLQRAQKNRYSLNDEAKLHYINKDIKREIILKKVSNLKHKREIQSQAIQRRLRNRFEKLEQIQSLKKKLDKERNKVIKNLSYQRKTMEVNLDSKLHSFFDL